MARAEVASASVSTDLIKGLAQSIAKPAYRRLLTAEPALRRAVPALIIAFLLTICVGAIVQVLDHRRQTISELVKQIDAAGDLLADRLERFEREKPGRPDRRLQTELEYMLPVWGRIPGRQVFIASPDGMIIAGLRFVAVNNGDGTTVTAVPLEATTMGRNLIDVLGPVQPLTTLGSGRRRSGNPDGATVLRRLPRFAACLCRTTILPSCTRAARRSEHGCPTPR